MKRLLPLLALAALLLGGALWLGTQRGAEGPPPLGALAQDAGEVDTSGLATLVQGAEDAPVTMIEYSSFTCPHCRAFHEEVLPGLEEDYIDAGLVRHEYREVYFDRYGLWASMVARCAGPERFFPVAELLYERQPEWARLEPADAAAALRRIGVVAGMSAEQVAACLSDADTAQALVALFEERREADGITSTPTFIIDGEVVANRPEAELRALLDAALTEAGATPPAPAEEG